MDYRYPPLELLRKTEDNIKLDRAAIMKMAECVVEVMAMWKVAAKVVDIRPTPISVCFDVMPEEGSTVKNLQKMKADFEVRLGCSIEIFMGDAHNHTFTIVILPEERPLVGLGNLLDSDDFKNAGSPLTFATGINYNGKIVLTDIEELPHMLVAGTTGSGKTVFMDDLIMSILYKATPEQVKMIMIDPKMVDLTFYNGIPHLLAPVVYEEDKIFGMLGWIEAEMMRRYDKFSESKVKNIQVYNSENGNETLPQILVIIDEYSELMMDYGEQFEAIIDRIGRLGRAAGIHLVIATQRATSDVITNSIKSNLTCRASFTVVDWRESNAIINKAGARHLCGAGDMLFAMSSTAGMEHVQAPLVTEKEIKDVVKFVSNNSKEHR